MKIYKISGYIDVGHNPAPDNPVWIWSIDKNGQIIKKFTTSGNIRHFYGTGGTGVDISNSIAQGRYEVVSGICSIYYHGYKDDEKVSSKWIKSILRETFHNIKDFEEHNCHESKANNVPRLILLSGVDYTEIGHDASESNPVFLWTMDGNGYIKSQKIENNEKGHINFFGVKDYNEICQGRYEAKTGICSIFIFNGINSGAIEWIKLQLKQKYPNIAKFYTFNKSQL